MEEVSFQAFEIVAGGGLQQSRYQYRRNGDNGWDVYRQGQRVLRLGAGYELAQTLRCGVCATDLSRHQLPFALPQIAGHEVVALWQGRAVVVDINAAHWHRDSGIETCPWCRNGLANHCPERLTLGIDRLPGGFAPWLLVPRRAVHPLPAGLDPDVAVVAEPLAAALRALERTPPDAGDVAVVGAGRLGLLLIAALQSMRETTDAGFTITAVLNRGDRRQLCLDLGADRVLMAADLPRGASFPIVYESSGSAAGLELALAIATRVVHIKSTTGLPAAGLSHPAALVISELNIAAAGSGVAAGPVFTDPASLERFLDQARGGCPTPPGPGGFLLLSGSAFGARPFARAVLERGLQVHSSRCGSLPKALEMLRDNPRLAALLTRDYLTHGFAADRLEEAFACSRSDSAAVKVVVNHSVTGN